MYITGEYGCQIRLYYETYTQPEDSSTSIAYGRNCMLCKYNRHRTQIFLFRNGNS